MYGNNIFGGGGGGGGGGKKKSSKQKFAERQVSHIANFRDEGRPAYTVIRRGRRRR
jgi:hypothetical protein